MKNKWILLGIIVVAIIVRVWQLGLTPPSPDWDEAALGYNAYSMIHTGRDEYGTRLPVALRSFDDYKPPLYMYLAIPFVAIFGLDTWVVRLPSVIAGVLAVWGTYHLVLYLFQKREHLALLGAGLLAISPWHIQFSRIAFEANIGVTINIWAVVFFLKGLTGRGYLYLSAFLFGLGLYAYHSERIFLPFLVILLSIFYWREIQKKRTQIVVAIGIGIITVLPLLLIFLDPNTLTRLRGTSSLSDQTLLLSRSVKKLAQDQESGNLLGIVFDNRRLVWAKTLMSGYLSHYSLRWLFLAGDNPRHHAPDVGLLYLFELPFFFWGLYYLIVRWRERSSKLVLGWFLIAPIAASPTTELPHAIRTLVFLPTFQIMIALGIREAYGWVHGLRIRNVFLGLAGLLIAFNIMYFLHMYFVHMNREFSQFWQYGYKQAVEYARANQDKYKKIVVSTQLEQPHMFFLYFLKYDPIAYLENGGTASGGFEEVRNAFDTYEFRPIHWDQELRDRSELYIGTPKEIKGTILLSIPYLDGTEAIRIAQQ